jgi:hypothetical protein
MRIFLILLSVLAFAPDLFCEEEQQKDQTPVIVYPKELLVPLPVIDVPDPGKKEEFVEVESEAYPGLNFDLPELDQLISIGKYEKQLVAHGAQYYAEGGNPVLDFYGITYPTSQLFSVPVPTGLEEKERK